MLKRRFLDQETARGSCHLLGLLKRAEVAGALDPLNAEIGLAGVAQKELANGLAARALAELAPARVPDEGRRGGRLVQRQRQCVGQILGA